MKVVVVGGGIAGTAAAWQLARAGAEVVVLHDRAGSSALYSGALDGDEPDADAIAFAAALGVWSVEPCVLATADGLSRPARGRDSALLDLSGLSDRRVAVADVARDGWDARLVARAVGGEAVPVRGLREQFEQRVPDWDFAALHDDPARADWLAAELARAASDVDAWLVGPWLGTRPGVAARISSAVGKPVGETLSGVGGPAGSRFEHARDALLGAALRRGRVTRVGRDAERWSVELEGGETIGAEAVVLATGGVAAGGLRLQPPLAGHAGGAGFELSLDAPALVVIDGAELDGASTLHGVDFEKLGRSALERVGAASDAPGLFVAGDLLADRPRTALEAATSGIAAARAASA